MFQAGLQKQNCWCAQYDDPYFDTFPALYLVGLSKKLFVCTFTAIITLVSDDCSIEYFLHCLELWPGHLFVKEAITHPKVIQNLRLIAMKGFRRCSKVDVY